MKAVKLAGLEPARVFDFFEEICSIPHGSRNEKLISDYLVNFAKEKNYSYAWVLEVHDEALKTVQRLLDEKYL